MDRQRQRIFLPAKNFESWRALLVSDKHWRDKFSAKELAKAWQPAVGGFPDSIRGAFIKSGLAACKEMELLVAFPEFLTWLPPDRGEPSHSDIFALAKSANGLFSVTVEGKVAEPFGQRVADWLKTPGQQERLSFLSRLLGDLDEKKLGDQRYQLLHRTAAALIEAKRFCATHALMLVHSLNPDINSSFLDYSHFCSLFNLTPDVGEIYRAGAFGGIELYLGWVNEWGATKFD